MYEHLRTEFRMKLENIPGADADRILNALDSLMQNYEIKEKTTDLALIRNSIPREVEIYLASLKLNGYAAGTLSNKRGMLRNFFYEVNMDPKDITANTVRMYLFNYQQGRKIDNSSIEKIRQCLSAFFSWCVNEEYISKNPMQTIRPIKCEKKQRHALDHLELERLRMACKDSRERAMIEFMYSTGCRVSELCSVKRSDVDFINGTVHLFGKGNKHRTSYINAKAVVALTEYLSSRSDDSEYLFVSTRGSHSMSSKAVEDAFRKIADRVQGISKKVTPHVLRHTTATLGLSSGMPVQELQVLLGHASINTTMIYAEVAQNHVQESHKRYIV